MPPLKPLTPLTPFTFADLFSGIGGFHQAAASLGGRAIIACEKESELRTLYKLNYGLLPHDDVRTLPKPPVALDLICAGPPCQTFSHIGNQDGTGDARGRLIYVTARYILSARPKTFIIENVKGLIHRSAMKRLLTMLKAEYEVAFGILDAANFGVPQHRERVYIIGRLKSGKTTDTTDIDAVFTNLAAKKSKSERVTFASIADVKPDESLLSHKFDDWIKEHGLLDPAKSKTATGFVLRAKRNGYINNKLFSSSGIVGTLCATYIPTIYDERNRIARRLSIREMCICQGFGSFNFNGASRTAISHHIGNAVCVPVVRELMRELLTGC